jgi:hypothetical protein
MLSRRKVIGLARNDAEEYVVGMFLSWFVRREWFNSFAEDWYTFARRNHMLIEERSYERIPFRFKILYTRSYMKHKSKRLRQIEVYLKGRAALCYESAIHRPGYLSSR